MAARMGAGRRKCYERRETKDLTRKTGSWGRTEEVSGELDWKTTIMAISKAKVRAVDGALGVVLPKRMLDKLRVAVGDSLYLVETPNGFVLTRPDDELTRQLEAARKVMIENRESLEKLGDS